MSEPNPKDLFKFKSLKLFCESQFLFNDQRKYRKIFDKNELAYIYPELSLYNKKFDEEEWNLKIDYKIFKITENGHRESIADYPAEMFISKDINIIINSLGWGNESKATFWNKGEYIWEAWAFGELLASTEFYVMEQGKITSTYNPYYTIESVKLYTGPGGNVREENRKYLSQLNANTTQYLWAETRLKNLLDESYGLEIFWNFHNINGEHVGQDYRIYKVPANQKDVVFTYATGWGHENPGTWKPGKYTLNIVSMGALLAIVPFEVGEAEVEGLVEVVVNPDIQTVTSLSGGVNTTDMEMTLEESLSSLDHLIGLSSVKEQIREQIGYLNYMKIRQEKGIDDQSTINLHSVFTGNPGTGKTTVVNLLGKIYKAMKLLSKGHVIEAGRADLVGEYIGQTAPRTRDMIEKARGGILFIDEAYSLVRDASDAKDFGREVLEVLIKEMSDGKGDIAIMFAGYPKEMNVFINANPGLKSRIGQYFHFDDYLPDELMEIALLTADKKKVALSPEAQSVLKKRVVEAYRSRDNTFGNARFVVSVVNEAKQNLGLRVMNSGNTDDITHEELSTITAIDVMEVFDEENDRKLKLEVDEPMLKDALDELNDLIGLDTLKNEISEQVKLVRYYKEIGREVLNKFSLHAVFTGNPGTGKTTVARILARIYKALGLLERGHLVECDRERLVAGYSGQTAIKTKDAIEQAMGGVLFIDEAYALTNDSSDSFGKEAVETILKNMEDLRGKFAVIVAGYPDNMSQFMESNPGLKSRFDHTYHFTDYAMSELYAIAMAMLEKEHLTPDEAAAAHLQEYLQTLYDHRDKNFGNAREVRKMAEKAVRNQHLRLASMEKSERTEEAILTLTFDDVKEFIANPDEGKQRIGFR